MPELPEVEVTRRRIAPLVVGRSVRALTTTPPSYFFVTPPSQLKRRLIGRRVDALTRHGKYLFCLLDDGSRLMLHLGMTGQLFGAGATSVRLLSTTSRAALAPERQVGFCADQHTHLIFHFNDPGPDVLFRDVRKFGKVLWLGAGATHPRIDKLGVDALLAQPSDVQARAGKRRAPIKSVLLDQAVLAGVGNIYADEALYLAKIHPNRPALKLTKRDWQRLIEAAQQVMRRSIELGGSSISDYVQPDGSDGAYQDERQVYARENQACRACGRLIQRLVIAQRSSHFCPGCQRR